MSTPSSAQIDANNLEETFKLLVRQFEEAHPDLEVLGISRTIQTRETNCGPKDLSFFVADIKLRFK